MTCRNSRVGDHVTTGASPDADSRHLGLNPHGTVRRGEELYRKLGAWLSESSRPKRLPGSD
jgi:hypothetical protein